MGKRIDLTGRTFGKWIVLGHGSVRNTHAYWWCKCACGAEQAVDGSHLKRGTSTQCRKCAPRTQPVLDRNQITRLLLEGYTHRQVAAQLGCHPNTISSIAPSRDALELMRREGEPAKCQGRKLTRRA